MKHRIVLIPAVMVLLLVVLVGCNLPISPTPTPFVFPTPNMTLTAIFNPPVVIPPTVTPPSIQTATSVPPPVSPTPVSPTTAPTSVLPTVTPFPLPLLPTPTAAAPTSAPATVRTGVSATAAFLSTAPTIDGTWDEWNTTQYAIKNVIYGKPKWTGAADLEGAYRVGWDNTYLYLAVKVTDDIFAQNQTGANIFKGDSIDFLVDTNLSGDYYTQSLSGDDYQIGISAGKGEVGKDMEAYLWYPQTKTGGLSGVKMAAVPMQDGYRIEAAIPWAVLGVTPANGMHLGFAVSISDDDKTNENVQETMVSSVNRSLTDPTTWGDLVLQK